MPSAQLYFRDPDGHLLELIALLDDTPDPFRTTFTVAEQDLNQAIRETAGVPPKKVEGGEMIVESLRKLAPTGGG